jgi:hypothetical protein
VAQGGKWSDTETGTPQGSVISPFLANIYLHYVFDLWVDVWCKKCARGEVIVLRYADDIVPCANERSCGSVRGRSAMIVPTATSLTTDHDKRFVAGLAHNAGCRSGLSSSAGRKKQAMEMTEYGKGGNPFGIPTLPTASTAGYMSSHVPQVEPSPPLGDVTDVSGPQRNGCPGTLSSTSRSASDDLSVNPG